MKLMIIILFTTIISSCSSCVKTSKLNNEISIFDNELLIKNNGKKWGVVDGNGKQVIPFICDGIKSLSDSLGIASIYSGSYSLNTGVPRYVYCGRYFIFTKRGRKNHKEKNFSIIIEYRSDFHNENVVLETPNRFLPVDTISNRLIRCEQFDFFAKPK